MAEKVLTIGGLSLAAFGVMAMVCLWVTTPLIWLTAIGFVVGGFGLACWEE